MLESNEEKYTQNISIIQQYFDISEDAATYIFFRRKRSFPWKKKQDNGYLFWNAKFQNALIAADSIIGFDWKSLEYGKEEEVLKKYGIYVCIQSNNLFRERKNDEIIIYDDNEWTFISKRKKSLSSNKIALQKMGLLPKK